MNRTLHRLVREDLCPNDTWSLTAIMKSLLRNQIFRLPKGKVSETDTRYPVTPASMRAFLEVFFTRHYFQIQNSLIDYMVSRDFLDIIETGHLRILDIGSGPAVASLAITDMLRSILENLKNLGDWSKRRTVSTTYVLNDTSGICLSVGQCMLSNYFRVAKQHGTEIIFERSITLPKGFPGNMNQVRRISLNLGRYDIVILSYVLVPLKEDSGLSSLVDGLLNTERLCNQDGRILIMQDRFNVSLMRQISKSLGSPSRREELTQQIYPKRDGNETYTYSYYSCLFAGCRKKTDVQSAVA